MVSPRHTPAAHLIYTSVGVTSAFVFDKGFEFLRFKQTKNKAYSVAFPPCSWHGRGRKGMPNRLQNYKFLLTSAQDLAEICYKKLQIANFSAVGVRKWWKFSNFWSQNKERQNYGE